MLCKWDSEEVTALSKVTEATFNEDKPESHALGFLYKWVKEELD